MILDLTRLRFAVALVAVAGLAGCYRPPPSTRADTEIKTDCRQQVERQYNAQNRVDLTQRVDRDTAFANSYNSGISSRGLGAEFHRDQMLTDCMRAAGDSAPQQATGVGPAFSPANAGSGPSSLRP